MAPEEPEESIRFSRGLLIREVMRQAFLLAAREELGLVTRDEVLGESFPDALPEPKLVLNTVFRAGQSPRVIVRRDGPGGEELLHYMPAQAKDTKLNPVTLVATADRQTRDIFPEALRKAGFRGTRNKVSTAPLPNAVDSRLNEMTIMAQFSALQELHRAIRAQGESPQLLGGLVRAYANLGVLTEHHWHPAHKVFKVRALLYAQRMIGNDPKGAWPLWHRGYARALTGIHHLSLSDLEAARKRRGIEPEPEWADLINAYCRFDSEKLAGSVRGPQAQLARLLHFLSTADPAVRSLTIKSAEALLRENPECYRVHDANGQVGGVGHLHGATLEGMRVLTEMLPQRLGEMPHLPARTRELLKAQAEERELTKSLLDEGRSAKDVAEPSWGLLGHMIREERFLQACRRLDFMANRWSVPVDGFLKEIEPLVVDHPYRRFLDTYLVDVRRDRAAHIAALKSLTLKDLELSAEPLLWAWSQADPAGYKKVALDTDIHSEDPIYQDICLRTRTHPKEEKPSAARATLAISPHSPFARAVLIENDWEYAKERLADWLKTHGKHPQVLAALGRRYREMKQWEEAEASLKQYISLSPDLWAYRALAQNYKDQGQIERWRQTLEDYLRQEDHGLEHAQVRSDIALYYMGRKEWRTALPYAEAAAQTGAGWAMLYAALCYEGLQDWQRAEALVKLTCERYPDWSFEWFFWCHRTRRGEMAQARRFAEQRIGQLGDNVRSHDIACIAAFHWLTGDKQKALDVLQKGFSRTRGALVGIFGAVLADELKAVKLRDDFLEPVATSETPLKPIAAELQSSLRRKQALDLPAVDKALAALDNEGANVSYLVGRFLELQGEAKKGNVYLERSAASLSNNSMWRTMAIQALRAGGAAPGKDPR